MRPDTPLSHEMTGFAGIASGGEARKNAILDRSDPRTFHYLKTLGKNFSRNPWQLKSFPSRCDHSVAVSPPPLSWAKKRCHEAHRHKHKRSENAQGRSWGTVEARRTRKPCRPRHKLKNRPGGVKGATGWRFPAQHAPQKHHVQQARTGNRGRRGRENTKFNSFASGTGTTTDPDRNKLPENTPHTPPTRTFPKRYKGKRGGMFPRNTPPTAPLLPPTKQRREVKSMEINKNYNKIEI